MTVKNQNSSPALTSSAISDVEKNAKKDDVISGAASSSISPLTSPNIQKESKELKKSPKKVTFQTDACPKEKVNLIMVRINDKKRGRLPCFDEYKYCLLGDSQLLRAGSQSSVQLNCSGEHNLCSKYRFSALAQSGLKLKDIDENFFNDRFCCCLKPNCKPAIPWMALGVNDFIRGHFNVVSLERVITELRAKYGPDLILVFTRPWVNINSAYNVADDLQAYNQQIEDLLLYDKNILFVNPDTDTEIEYNSKSNIHVSWKTGPKTWQNLFGKVDDAICKITKPEMDQEQEWINLEEGNTELDLGLNLNSKDFEVEETSSSTKSSVNSEQKSQKLI